MEHILLEYSTSYKDANGVEHTTRMTYDAQHQSIPAPFETLVATLKQASFVSLTITIEEITYQLKSKSASKRSRSKLPIRPLTDEESQVFQYLREIRWRLAQERGQAAYMILPDVTLKALAIYRPTHREKLAQLPGFGPSKLEEYAQPFLEALQRYGSEQSLRAENEPAVTEKDQSPAGENYSISKRAGKMAQSTIQVLADQTVLKRPQLSFNYQQSVTLFEEGLSVQEIAQRRGLAISTINAHLARAIELGVDIQWERLVPDALLSRVAEAIRQVGDNSLRTIKEYLEQFGEEVSYEILHFARAVVRGRQKDENAPI